jgi:acetylglutamate kinase
MKAPRGFRFAGVHAGIKASRKDLALIAADVPCQAAARFTRNAAASAPILHARASFPATSFQGLVITSGNANALTGAEGVADCRDLCVTVARELGVPEGSVIASATGVIGVRWPMHKLLAAVRPLVEARGPHLGAAAEAILTTDTRVKLVRREATIGGRSVHFAAIAKGSGMVAPSLATILVAFTTDANVPAPVLDAVLGRVCGRTFEQLDLDGAQSTNDSVFAFASGLAGHAAIGAGSAEESVFEALLEDMAQELCRELADDGEGASRRIDVTVRGASSERAARSLARAIAGDNLVKAAIFGADPNWGRIVAALGARIGAESLPDRLESTSVSVAGIVVFDEGKAARFDAPALRKRMREPAVSVAVDLRSGSSAANAWGCDLSYDYVKINADYASFTQTAADGTVSRDDRIGNYSPALKRAILVEALSYIAKFENRRAVVAWVGEALGHPALAATLAGDVNLLQSAGVFPLVVHGYTPELQRVLEDESADRSMGNVEMLLTGRTNAEFVAALNQHRAHAVGISGKDGGAVRARLASDPIAEPRRGAVANVHGDLLEVLLGKGYVPVISPVGLAEDGASCLLEPAEVAAAIAAAIRADKLLLLADAPGITVEGELINQIDGDTLAERLERGEIDANLRTVAHAALLALREGVPAVHVIDGRLPHTLIAELFTDRGVGTLIRPRR